MGVVDRLARRKREQAEQAAAEREAQEHEAALRRLQELAAQHRRRTASEALRGGRR